MVKAAILHEGPDDKLFIKSLLEYLELKDKDFERFHFIDLDSKSNFFKTDYEEYLTLKQWIDAGQIDKILFVIDSDYKENDAKYGGFENTEIQLRKVIDELGFQDIARSYIVCDPQTKTGYLESLILASLPEQKRKCIERFVECSEMNSKRIHKTIIYGLCKVGYPNSPIPHYNFDHSHFDELKAELKKLYNNLATQ